MLFMHSLSRRLAIATGAAFVATAFSLPVDAQFYKGKTITLISGYSGASGVTVSAQLFAEHWKKHIPGQPKMVVKVLSGGGGSKAQNFIYEKARNNGLTLYWGPIAVVGKTVGNPGYRAEYHELEYFGGYGDTLVTYGRKDARPALFRRS